MKRVPQASLLMWFTAVAAMNILGSNASGDDNLQPVRSMINMSLQGIPRSDESSSVTKLVIEGNLITLNEEDRHALATYPRLVELHLDGNLVTRIPAQYFSVVPQLRVLSLSRNKVSSLDVESFSGLDVLTELDLSYNLLRSLHTQLFRRLNKLQVLNLQGNPWNCSCPLLSSMEEVKAAGVTGSTGEPEVTCESLESQTGKDLLQATAVCYPSTPPTFTKDQHKPATEVNIQQSTGLEKTLESQNHIKRDQTPALGNTWKFTACVMALALCTSMLIVCGIRGPSWYKLFHDYRHRRLCQEEEEDAVSTTFTQTGGYVNQQTFTFEQESRGTEEEEEEEDGYFEDPYIKSEE